LSPFKRYNSAYLYFHSALTNAVAFHCKLILLHLWVPSADGTLCAAAPIP